MQQNFGSSSRRRRGALKWMGDLLMPCVTHEVDGLEIAVEKKTSTLRRVPRDGTKLVRLPRKLLGRIDEVFF